MLSIKSSSPSRLFLTSKSSSLLLLQLNSSLLLRALYNLGRLGGIINTRITCQGLDLQVIIIVFRELPSTTIIILLARYVSSVISSYFYQRTSLNNSILLRSLRIFNKLIRVYIGEQGIGVYILKRLTSSQVYKTKNFGYITIRLSLVNYSVFYTLISLG